MLSGNARVFKTAIVVSKKVAAKAVERNRTRRIVAQSIRTNLDDINFEGELVIIVKKNLSELKTPQITKLMLNLIHKL